MTRTFDIIIVTTKCKILASIKCSDTAEGLESPLYLWKCSYMVTRIQSLLGKSYSLPSHGGECQRNGSSIVKMQMRKTRYWEYCTKRESKKIFTKEYFD